MLLALASEKPTCKLWTKPISYNGKLAYCGRASYGLSVSTASTHSKWIK